MDITVRRENSPPDCFLILLTPMARGFICLAAVVDWFSRRVLSWRVSISLEADFCVEALEEALARYGQPEIFNTDQGSQGGFNRSSQLWRRASFRTTGQ